VQRDGLNDWSDDWSYAKIEAMKRKPKTISATEFKSKCLKIFDELEGEGIIVEKRGKPVAKVIPFRPTDNTELIGSMKGMIKVKGDIFSTGIKWDAES
jgi:antitoxin (DNA-binding transcriptional repressor) of toxin-antitoxin stability system